MFRSVSTRGGPSKYEKLEKDYSASNGTTNHEELKRNTSVPSRESSSYNYGDFNNLQRNPTNKISNNSNHNKEKSHPIFSFFDIRRKKKKTPTATPEITRYMEYLKEGGMWDSDSNKPVIYYK